ncbi:MAG: nucleotidyltransferase domain-containing protein [Chloroflexi bacterium]|nr:nucleotidyltransferase domain-containing protein [Chloroflexota bacterium]
MKQWVRDGTLDGFRRGSRILVLKNSVVRLQNEGKAGRGGAVRTIVGARAGDAKNRDALSALLELPERTDQTQRARILAGTVAEIRRRVRPTLRGHGISRAFLFGSAARGDVSRRSDIDIAVELPANSTLDLVGFVGLGLELEGVLGRKVDLVNSATMKPRIRERVEMEQVSIL